MPAYVITGTSRGLGWEFLRQLSRDPSNMVIGIVRDKPATEKKILEHEEMKTRSNVHLLQASMTDYNALKKASEDITRITGGSLDYIIANAGIASHYDAYDPIGDLGDPQVLEEELMLVLRTNMVGNIHLFNLLMPLILKGRAKKVITISSGHADNDLVNNYDLGVAPLYSISKAAMNTAVSKFNAQYKKDGVLFMAICPGMVEVGHFNNATPEQINKLTGMLGLFKEYAPNFTGPAQPEDAIRDVLSVINNASVEHGDGGAFLSHLGTKQWL